MIIIPCFCPLHSSPPSLVYYKNPSCIYYYYYASPTTIPVPSLSLAFFTAIILSFFSPVASLIEFVSLQSILDPLVHWCSINSLTLNIRKCFSMCCSALVILQRTFTSVRAFRVPCFCFELYPICFNTIELPRWKHYCSLIRYPFPNSDCLTPEEVKKNFTRDFFFKKVCLVRVILRMSTFFYLPLYKTTIRYGIFFEVCINGLLHPH